MDAKAGHCWRCHIQLPGEIVTCNSCEIAQYCSSKCRKEDQLRHTSVECPTWSRKNCGNCSKLGAKYNCGDCHTVHYCSTDCQKKHWSQHKTTCRLWKNRIEQAARRPLKYIQDFPFYFSNSFANDLLNLNNNEAKSSAPAKNKSEITGTFRILLPACGDLRQMIQTIYSLPANFKGNLKFVLNDIDPFAMARNVLILYMISVSTKEIAPLISSIWLSLLLSEKENYFLREMLSRLIRLDSVELRDGTQGAINVSATSYQSLRSVWLEWLKLMEGMGTNLGPFIQEQRKLLFATDPLAAESLNGYIQQVPKRHARSIRKWLEDGVIANAVKHNKELPFGNPTFTGRPMGLKFFPGQTIDFPLVYSVRCDCIAFQIWDYLDMIQLVDCDSVTEMCHVFTTHCVTMTATMMKSKRLTLQTFVQDFLNLDKFLPADDRQFDRIFASNVIDFHEVGTVVKTLGTFLNKDNPHAVLLTETFNWHFMMDGADYPVDQESPPRLLLRAAMDIDPTMSRFLSMTDMNYSFTREYYNNIDYFISYLRGRKLAETYKQSSSETGHGKTKLPKWTDVKNWGGLHLRDFLIGRNKVVPFCRRVNVRAVNMVRGSVRMLEWYRMDATT